MSRAVSVDRRSALIAVGLLLAGFIAGYTTLSILHHQEGTVATTPVVTTGELTRPRSFVGAYAIYKRSGSDDFLMLYVAESNSTHVKVAYAGWISWKKYANSMVVRFGEPIIPIATRPTFRNEETEYVDGIGTRVCLVYTSKGWLEDVIVYVDKETLWPVKFVFDKDVLVLVDTNVFRR